MISYGHVQIGTCHPSVTPYIPLCRPRVTEPDVTIIKLRCQHVSHVVLTNWFNFGAYPMTFDDFPCVLVNYPFLVIFDIMVYWPLYLWNATGLSNQTLSLLHLIIIMQKTCHFMLLSSIFEKSDLSQYWFSLKINTPIFVTLSTDAISSILIENSSELLSRHRYRLDYTCASSHWCCHHSFQFVMSANFEFFGPSISLTFYWFPTCRIRYRHVHVKRIIQASTTHTYTAVWCIGTILVIVLAFVDVLLLAVRFRSFLGTTMVCIRLTSMTVPISLLWFLLLVHMCSMR